MTEENSKWLVVVNPKASIGKAGKDWPEIKQLFINEGIAFDFVLTEYHKHAIELVDLQTASSRPVPAPLRK